MKRIPEINESTNLKLTTDSRAVAVTLYGGGELWGKAFRSLLINTREDVPIVIFEDAYKDDHAIEMAHQVYDEFEFPRVVFLHRNEINLGVVANLNVAFRLLAPADVVVLNSDVIVGPNWLEGLEGALIDPTIATVTALSTNSTIFTVPEAAHFLGSNPSVDDVGNVASKIWSQVDPIYPEIPTTVSCCALFRRRALEIAGDLDTYFSPGYGEETDFSLRCTQYGFRHVAADNVLVFHEGGVSFGTGEKVSARKLLNDKEVERRYPFFRKMVVDLENDKQHPLNIAIRFCEVLIRGLEIVVDGTLINENHTGTFVGAVGLLSGLVSHASVREVTVIVSPVRVRALRTMFEKMNLDVQVLTYSQLRDGDFDIGFVPHQVYNPQVFDWMQDHAYRRVVWHLDFISTTIPKYFRDNETFFYTRNVVKRSFAASDGIFFLTNGAINLAKSKGLDLDLNRTFILPSAPDIAISDLVQRENIEDIFPHNYILVLGLGFQHKNREFIETIFSKIRLDFPNLWLIFAGPYPTYGGDDLNLGDRVVDFGKVDDDKRQRLIESATLVISASIIEGFGLAPLEAAKLNSVPIVSNTLGYESHGSAPYWINLDSLEKSISTVSQLLCDGQARNSQLEAWKRNAAQYSWKNSGSLFVSASIALIAMPNKVIPLESIYFAKLNWKGKLVDLARRSGIFPEGSTRRKVAAKAFHLVKRRLN